MSAGSALLAMLAQAVDAEMRDLLAEVRTANPLHDHIAYHMGWNPGGEDDGEGRAGKRLRPLLLLLVQRALGGEAAAALPVAAGIEFLHSAALVYDDIQDASPLRRGRPAVWRVCGPERAINVGVCLQAAVHLAVTRAFRAGLRRRTVVAVCEELSTCTLRLAEGQWLDLTFHELSDASVDEYLRMCAGKTASLLSSSAYLGAVIAGRTDLAPAARAMGQHVGMYLQIEDDIAGIWGDCRVIGKLPADMQARKQTLPLLYLRQAVDVPAEALRLVNRYFGGEDLNEDELAALRDHAEALGGRAYAEGIALKHREAACDALDAFGPDIRSHVVALIDAIAASPVTPA